MKTADLQPILDAVRNIEKKELVNALRQHGGKYNFEEEPAGQQNLCCVEFYNEMNGPNSGIVQNVKLDEDGNITLTITDNQSESYEIKDSDVYPGCLSAVTAMLPEPIR